MPWGCAVKDSDVEIRLVSVQYITYSQPFSHSETPPLAFGTPLKNTHAYMRKIKYHWISSELFKMLALEPDCLRVFLVSN